MSARRFLAGYAVVVGIAWVFVEAVAGRPMMATIFGLLVGWSLGCVMDRRR